MTRIVIITGSTRPGRKADTVARWVHQTAQHHGGADYDLISLADLDLPRFNEPIPPIAARYEHEHTRAWAETVAGYDGYVFVTPEYNHSIPGALKDALDYLYAEWNDKAAGFVSYGVLGGVRAVEHLRLICAELKIAGVRTQVALNLDDIHEGAVHASQHQHDTLRTMLEEVGTWARALQALRVPA